MKRMLLLSLFFVAGAGIAAADQAPIVTSITPDRGPASGGTTVIIEGDELLPDVACVLPCPAEVTFGDVTVTVSDETDRRLTVVTPPHPAGTVDVIVRVAAKDPVVLAGAFTFDGGAQAGYEQVLLPIFLHGTVAGAHGSHWATRFWLRNNGNDPVTLAPWPCEGEACPAVFPSTYTLPGGTSLLTLPPFFAPPSGNPARLLYISPRGADVSFTLRLRDVSRQTLNAGTDMPVIRERELLTKSAQLFEVPMNANFRVMLRIYDTAYVRSQFRVVFYEQGFSGEQPLHSIVVTASTAQSGDFRYEPAFGQLDVTELLNLDDRAWPEVVRMEIVPLSPGSRYWPFASITNNETQLVTLVTPQ